ncbi:MAG TPA: phosphate acyltransferase [Dehalococcoidia bacterium]|nr:phosphate acyltransferase [Dehalococcoidia bacterium]
MTKANQRVTIAVDAMGGDYAPGELIKGAVIAAERGDVEVALVGLPDIIEAELAKLNTAQLPVYCIGADETIEETENPALAARRKPNSSIAVATKLVRDGEADALISAGPTGALATSALQYLGMIEGMERPVIGGAIFDDAPKTVVFDCGVNMDCRPYQLLTFAVIGTVYCQKLLNVANPTVGLLNIGAEETKGNQLTRESYQLLKRSGLNFIGNIEGNQIMSGKANAIVCDAFVGNVLFKFVESIGLFKDVPGARGYDQGGGLILGVNGIVRKLHGASKAPHVADTIHQAKAATKIDLIGALKSELRAVIKHTE